MARQTSIGGGSYRYSCINCGGTTTESRLLSGLPCHRCLSDEEATGLKGLQAIREALFAKGKLSRGLNDLARLEAEAEEFIEFFNKVVGSKAWGAQRTWARRLVRGDSFSISAPTGVGKSTFGIVAGLYLACRKGSKSYLVLPTTSLVKMMYERATGYAEKIGCNTRIVALHSKVPGKARIEAMNLLTTGDFDMLITTASYARKYYEVLSKIGFKLVFVDDVDAVLKSARSVDAILKIVGFNDEDISNGLELLGVQRRIAALRTILQRMRARESPSDGRRIEEVASELAELENKARNLEKVLSESRKKASILLISSATGRPRGARVKLFRVLLGFEAGGRSDIGLRRVVDAYKIPERDLYEEAVELVRNSFPDGTLVFVPIDHGIEGAERLAEMLRTAGVKAEAFHAKKPLSLLDEFGIGSINVLVGVANYYGVLVRGIDMPTRVKYAVFVGVPRHKFSASIGYPSPASITNLLRLLADLPIEDIAETARRRLAAVRRVTRSLSPAALQAIADNILEGNPEASKATRTLFEAYNFLLKALADEEIWRLLEERKDIAIVREGGERYILVADAPTYLQASGRTSRLYAGGITLGLSVVIVDDERVLHELMKRTSWMVDTKWVKFEELDLTDVRSRIEADRVNVKRVLSGGELGDLVKTALLIVESPNKARTIAGFFGQPSRRMLSGGLTAYDVSTGDLILTIVASGGHIYDLAVERLEDDLPPGVETGDWLFGVHVLGDKKRRDFHPIYTSKKRCLDCGYDFTLESPVCPVCGSPNIRDARVIVDGLRRLAWESDMVLVGTDPDTEGEKIGWDLALLLKPYSRSIKRLEFHEVTRKAILEALKKLRDFDQKLVDAQIVRRVEDRWIGFTLSPLLWCHFWPRVYCPSLQALSKPGRFQAIELERCAKHRYYYNLSAGRVQTPVLGWIIKRVDEAKEEVVEYKLEVSGSPIYFTELDVKGNPGKLRDYFKRGEKSVEVSVTVSLVKESMETISPPPPYTTDTLIVDANRYLRFSAPQTMRLAQDLFEMGFITYHRTDSTRVSDRGIEIAKEWIEEAFGIKAEELFKPRRWGEGGAHEAIRPTRPVAVEDLERIVEEGLLPVTGRLTIAHYRLYDLIFRRFIASQMRDVLAKRAVYRIKLKGFRALLEVDRIISLGESDSFASKGFTIVWPYLREQPPLKVGVGVAVLSRIGARSKVPLYTEGDLIRLMKERSIGRPSTYAKIVETLYRRRYITKGPGQRVIPTHRGRAVYDYLTRLVAVDPKGLEVFIKHEYLEKIPSLVSESRTRALQEKMEKIERGKVKRTTVMKEVYNEVKEIAKPIAGMDRGFREELRECLSRNIASREVEE